MSVDQAQMSAELAEAIAERDLARRIAVALEQQVAEALRLLDLAILGDGVINDAVYNAIDVLDRKRWGRP